MKILFILANDFPYEGSCTALLNNLLETDVFLTSEHKFAVLSLGSTAFCQTHEKVKNVDVYRTYLCRGIPTTECKKNALRNPWKVMQVLLAKVKGRINGYISHRAISDLDAEEIVRRLEEIGAEQFDVFVPMFGKLNLAAAALKIKKKYPQKKLVLYQVDPCSSNQEYPDSVREELCALEKELYWASDRIITTPILLREAQQKYSEAVLCKMTAMEFPNITNKRLAQFADLSNDKRCLFTGSLYSNIRDPEYTFRLFYRLDSRIRLELVGAISAEDSAKCEKYEITAHGLKTIQDTRTEIEKAHVLVNIGNTMLNQVPSKLFEYISYGKPIINICKNRNCSTLPYLAHYPYALNLFEEEDIFEEQRERLLHFIEDNYDKCIPFEQIAEEYKTSTPEHCAEQMLGIFGELR